MKCALFPLLLLLLFTVTAQAAPSDRALFEDTFETLAEAPAPYAWQALEGEWLIAQRTTHVFRQETEDITGDSWALALWANYSTVTKCLAEDGEGPWGVGLTAYDDGHGRCYRLRLGEGRIYLEKVFGSEVRVLAEAEAKVTRAKWYSLRLAINTTLAETTLAAKLWGSTDDEPRDWLLSARDSRAPYRGGSVGLWTGNCAARFSYLSTKRYDPRDDRSGELLYGTDFSDTAQGKLPAFWRAEGGLWVRDTQDKLAVLRQMSDQAGPMYDDNAAAMLLWTGYTVSAMAIAHPGNAKWGIGLVAYYSPGGSSYRLRTLDNKAYLVKRSPDGSLDTLAVAVLPLKRGQWYTMKLAVDNLAAMTRLQGKVWASEEEEPVNWQLTTYDDHAPLRGGAPGLWCFGSAVDFDNFQVRTSTLSSLNESLR